MNNRTKTVLGFALMGSLVGSGAHAAFITFDAASEITDNFTVQSSGGTLPTFNSGNGVGGVAGFADITNSGGIFFNDGIAKSLGETYRVSYLIKIGTPANDINDYRAGFIRSTGSNFAGGGDSAYAYLRSDPGVATYTVELFGTNSSLAETAQFSLASDAWYELRLDMVLDSDTQVDLVASVFSRGANGTAAPTLVAGSEVSVDDTVLGNGGFSNADIWGGFTVRNNTGSVGEGLDDFFAGLAADAPVIPEPGSMALLVLGTTVMAARRRRG
ncbi:MAG: PEP-CTERM sorting domain-containing protein [Planctomycetota bacterium]